MELAAAEKLARQLMGDYGLTDWRFAFDRARRRFGCCAVSRRRISLSAHLVRLNSDIEVRDTILHEIAHALTPGDGHGAAWRAACRRIGARPERCFKESQGVNIVKGWLRVGCPRCNWWADRHRVTWALQVCRRCRQSIVWEHARSGKRYAIERAGSGFKAIPLVGAALQTVSSQSTTAI